MTQILVNFDDASCIKCHKNKIYENSDNLCVGCYEDSKLKDRLCKSCKTYYRNKTDYCSQCEISQQYSDKDLSLNEILDLPDSDFKGRMMNNMLDEILSTYLATNNLKSQPIKSEHFFKFFLGIIKNKSAFEIKEILTGKTEYFTPCILTAKQADRLLDQLKISNKLDSQYIHAICPYVIDIWNIKNNHNVLLCYYKDFGELVKCPNRIAVLRSLWFNFV